MSRLTLAAVTVVRTPSNVSGTLHIQYAFFERLGELNQAKPLDGRLEFRVDSRNVVVLRLVENDNRRRRAFGKQFDTSLINEVGTYVC